MLRVIPPRYIPKMNFSYARNCGLIDCRSTLLSLGIRGSTARPLSNAPYSVLTIITPPAATAGPLPSLVMSATCSRYAPFVPVPNIAVAPRMHPLAVYARENAAPTF